MLVQAGAICAYHMVWPRDVAYPEPLDYDAPSIDRYSRDKVEF